MVRVEIDGARVTDVPSLCRAFEAAVGAPPGSWGSTLFCFDDRLFGGFGLEHPCEVIWRDSEVSRGALDGRALAAWAAGQLAAPDCFVDDAGRQWLERTIADGEAGRRTLFSEIVDSLESVTRRGGKSLRLVLA
ncbi:MAG: hypothetical protein JNL82_19905 [Myxococcales bacterium]|nr:hypothetical protein [Myxococcales bacterium]